MVVLKRPKENGSTHGLLGNCCKGKDAGALLRLHYSIHLPLALDVIQVPDRTIFSILLRYTVPCMCAAALSLSFRRQVDSWIVWNIQKYRKLN